MYIFKIPTFFLSIDRAKFSPENAEERMNGSSAEAIWFL